MTAADMLKIVRGALGSREPMKIVCGPDVFGSFLVNLHTHKTGAPMSIGGIPIELCPLMPPGMWRVVPRAITLPRAQFA